MELHIDARIPYPRELVFTVFRDELDRLAPYLPSIRSIAIKRWSRREDGTVDNAIEWRGGADIPAPLRAIIGDSMMAWTDHASWDERTLTCTWRTETHAFAEAVRCGAHDRFLADGPDATLLEIRGALEVDGAKIRGVPALLARAVGRRMETFLVAKIRAELAKTAAALARYIAERPPLGPGPAFTGTATRPAPSAAGT